MKLSPIGTYNDALNSAVHKFDVDPKTRLVNSFNAAGVKPHIRTMFLRQIIDGGRIHPVQDPEVVKEVSEDFRSRLSARLHSDFKATPAQVRGQFVQKYLDVYDGYVKKQNGTQDLTKIYEQSIDEFKKRTAGSVKDVPWFATVSGALPKQESHARRQSSIEQPKNAKGIAELRAKYKIASAEDADIYKLKSTQSKDDGLVIRDGAQRYKAGTQRGCDG
jgi:hypothetical protein